MSIPPAEDVGAATICRREPGFKWRARAAFRSATASFGRSGRYIRPATIFGRSIVRPRFPSALTSPWTWTPRSGSKSETPTTVPMVSTSGNLPTAS